MMQFKNICAARLLFASLIAAILMMPNASLAQADVKDRMVERRAIEAAVWGMPIVNYQAMRDGFKRDAGVGFNVVAYNSRVQTWRMRVTTNNNTTPYTLIFWNVKDGPVVVDIPASTKDVGLTGTLMDAWQRPLEDVGAKGRDKGLGAKYLITPPGYQGPYLDGYITLPQLTFNGFTTLRPIIDGPTDENLKKATAFVKTIKIYPFAKADNPPETKFVDIYDKDINGITEFDASFYERLNMMVQEEPIETKDLAMMGLLKAIGIEKGVAYAPDADREKILDAAGAEAHDYLLDQYVNGAIPLFYDDKQWSSAVPPGAVPTGMFWEFPGYLDVNGRGTGYFAFYTSFKHLGAATFYLMTGKDKVGQFLDGGKNYKLTLPKDVRPSTSGRSSPIIQRTPYGIKTSPRRGSHHRMRVSKPMTTARSMFTLAPRPLTARTPIGCRRRRGPIIGCISGSMARNLRFSPKPGN
jgi:hypothetical protein